MMPHLCRKLASALFFVVFVIVTAVAQITQPSTAQETKGAFLLTIFLKHDQSKPLEQINRQLRDQGFYKKFPPDGIEVVSWYVMMGIGQVVTLRVPAERLRDVNLAVEETAWGGYHKPIAEQTLARERAK
jgi:hypothetical protein